MADSIKEIPLALSNIGKYIGHTIEQVSSSNGRYYRLDGKRYKSVTGFIQNNLRQVGLEIWQEGLRRDALQARVGTELTSYDAAAILNYPDELGSQAAHIGTQFHEIVQALLADESADNLITDQLEPAVRAWLKWRKAHMHWKLMGTEAGVYAETGTHQPYAGQADAIFKYTKIYQKNSGHKKHQGEVYVVVDWKAATDYHAENYMQVAAYAKALHSMLIRKQIPFTEVEAMVVRVDNEYPYEEVEVEGRAKPKKIKFYDQPKIFTGTCYYVDVPVDWWYRKFANLMDAVRPNGQFNPKKVTL